MSAGFGHRMRCSGSCTEAPAGERGCRIASWKRLLLCDWRSLCRSLQSRREFHFSCRQSFRGNGRPVSLTANIRRWNEAFQGQEFPIFLWLHLNVKQSRRIWLPRRVRHVATKIKARAHKHKHKTRQPHEKCLIHEPIFSISHIPSCSGHVFMHNHVITEDVTPWAWIGPAGKFD